MYDEPTVISQLIRIAIVTVGMMGIEQALALGEGSEAELVALEKLLENEDRHPTALVALRGERAIMYQVADRVISGSLDPKELGLETPKGASWWESLTSSPRRDLRRGFPELMETLSEQVEVAKLPPEKQVAAAALGSWTGKSRTVTSLITPNTVIINACCRKTAGVRALRATIAAERYRMKTGKLPEKLEDLVPGYIARVPLDPYDGNPLRMVRDGDAMVIYSIGQDRKDDGGKLMREAPVIDGSDVGFQLWEKDKRAQPAKPRPKEQDPEMPGLPGEPGGPGGKEP